MAKIIGEKPTRVRYTIEISGNMDDVLTAIAEKRETSKADLIRTAARLLAEWDRLESSGYAFGGWRANESGGLDTERLVPMT